MSSDNSYVLRQESLLVFGVIPAQAGIPRSGCVWIPASLPKPAPA
jgi:hypothetical protein